MEPQTTYDYLQVYGNPLNPVFKDIDNGPTKAWFVTHRNLPEYKRLYELGFEKRPREELYDLKKDPDQLDLMWN